MDYISIIFLEYHYQRELLYSTEPFFVNIFFVSSTQGGGGTGEKGGEQEEEEEGEEKRNSFTVSCLSNTPAC